MAIKDCFRKEILNGEIYAEDGKELFDGSLLDSSDFVQKLKNRI